MLQASAVAQGSMVAIVTPMFEDGRLDIPSLNALIEFHIAQGSDGIVIVGTTGESPTVDFDEHCLLIKTAVEQVRGRVSVIAGTGANSTKEAIALTQKAKDLGVDACLLVAPYYNKPTQEGLYQHFMAIADAVAIPQILYNVPGRTGCDISNDTVLRLAQHSNIIGIKEASCIIEQCMEIAFHKPEDFLLISGDDVQAVPIISIGGVGVMSVIANAFPSQFTQMIHAALHGDYKTAQKALSAFLTIDPYLYEEGNPVGVKKILALKGLIQAQVRMPLAEASEGLGQKLNEIINQVKLSN